MEKELSGMLSRAKCRPRVSVSSKATLGQDSVASARHLKC